MRIDDDDARGRLQPPTVEWRTRPGLRDAAVLAPLFRDDGEDWLLFTKRQPDLKAHAGEICFPGGAREGGEDALACALREAEEEVGLLPDTVDVLGRLPERLSIAGYLVHPFVARIAEHRSLRLDPTEVDKVIPIPLRLLLEERRWEWRPIGRVHRHIPFFEHEGEMLWGLTGILTHDLLQRLTADGGDG